MSNKKKNSNYHTKAAETAAAAKQAEVGSANKKKLIISVAALLALVITVTVLIVAIPSKTDRMGTGGCEYYAERDLTGRDIYYVEICVEKYGRMVVLLDATTAPKTVENFITLVKAGFYDGLTFHRIIKDFMIQGGDPQGDGTGGSATNIYGEFSENGWENDISHKRGVISMARSGEPDSASSQFFICNDDAESSLDGKYAAFGYVVEGMSVVDEITEKVFPLTAYASYYGNYNTDPYYGYPYHYLWSYYGNGTVEKDSDKPVIKYIKVLDGWDG